MSIEQFFGDIKKFIDEDSIANSQNAERFNIFDILDLKRKEVKLHSRLLFELLKPDGSHLMGNKYLKLFLEEIIPKHEKNEKQIKLPGLDDENLNNVKIAREKDHIDLSLLFDDGYAIIIENKIDAYDQPEQLERYYNTFKTKYGRDSRKILVFYLTLYGHEPEQQSAGIAKGKVKLISYDDDIKNWLEKCIDITSDGNVLPVLKQYKKTIEYLTKTAESEKLMDNIGEYINKSKENFIVADKISKGLDYAKRDILMQFMTSLKDEFIQAGYDEEDITFGDDEINEYFFVKKNREDPTIVFKIGDLEENLFLDFGIGVYWQLYYYFAYEQSNRKNPWFHPEHKTIMKKYPAIHEKVVNAIWKSDDVNNSRQSPTSIKWDYIYNENGDQYDFKKFSPNCIDLIDNNEAATRRIAKNLLAMINNVKKELEK